jgi:hypothetical protein
LASVVPAGYQAKTPDLHEQTEISSKWIGRLSLLPTWGSPLAFS